MRFPAHEFSTGKRQCAAFETNLAQYCFRLRHLTNYSRTVFRHIRVGPIRPKALVADQK